MQLALIITLARRAFSDVYPVIKLDLRLLVARYLLFSAVAPGFVLSLRLPLFASLIRSLYHDVETLEARNRNYFHALRTNVVQGA